MNTKPLVDSVLAVLLDSPSSEEGRANARLISYRRLAEMEKCLWKLGLIDAESSLASGSLTPSNAPGTREGDAPAPATPSLSTRFMFRPETEKLLDMKTGMALSSADLVELGRQMNDLQTEVDRASELRHTAVDAERALHRAEAEQTSADHEAELEELREQLLHARGEAARWKLSAAEESARVDAERGRAPGYVLQRDQARHELAKLRGQLRGQREASADHEDELEQLREDLVREQHSASSWRTSAEKNAIEREELRGLANDLTLRLSRTREERDKLSRERVALRGDAKRARDLLGGACERMAAEDLKEIFGKGEGE